MLYVHAARPFTSRTYRSDAGGRGGAQERWGKRADCLRSAEELDGCVGNRVHSMTGGFCSTAISGTRIFGSQHK